MTNASDLVEGPCAPTSKRAPQASVGYRLPKHGRCGSEAAAKGLGRRGPFDGRLETTGVPAAAGGDGVRRSGGAVEFVRIGRKLGLVTPDLPPVFLGLAFPTLHCEDEAAHSPTPAQSSAFLFSGSERDAAVAPSSAVARMIIDCQRPMDALASTSMEALIWAATVALRR
ncbi:hypothetical protein ANO11243_038090 [Dothideomycetidae sp. 11243]|nr:hypothetical protein ANO11243_038090 [fungal sp. No.11243]